MNIKITIPTKQSEITLERFQRFAKIDKSSDEFVMRKMLQIFCDIDDVFQVSISDIEDISQKIVTALNEKPELTKTFTLDGVDYGFIPSLKDMCYGEYIDVSTYLSDWETMHKAISVCYRPITKQVRGFYDIEKYKGTETADKFKKLPLDIAMGLQLFFYHINKQLLQDGATYLRAEVMKLISQQGGSSQSGGDGLQQLHDWLTMMSQKLNK